MDAQLNERNVVLIVEDEPDNLEIMRAVVEDMLGYKALLARDGASAIEVATTDQPRMILMDLMMPVLDGFEAIRRLKLAEATSHIPVIAITALGRAVDRERALGDGADEYLSKPFDLDILVSVVQKYMDVQ